MIVVGRPINGITLNPLEYVLDNDGNEMVFADEETAKAFLREQGVAEDDFQWLVFETVEASKGEVNHNPPRQGAGTCPICGNEELEYGDSGIEDTGYYYRWDCPGCDSSGREWHNLVFDEHIIDTDVSCEG